MLTFICFKWAPPLDYRSQFGPESVRALQRMIATHYPLPHRFVCITDDVAGLDGIETMALWSDYAQVPNPSGTRNPSCYRRLKVFSAEARDWFGDRLVCMDLDTVIVGDLRPLFDRPEDFVIWGQTDFPKTQWYNGSLWMLRTGTRTKVWTEFDPKTSPQLAHRAGKRGSDQGWFSYILGPKEATWSMKDGVYSYRVHIRPNGGVLPENARFIAFHGHRDPWGHDAQQHDWVRTHWGQAA